MSSSEGIALSPGPVPASGDGRANALARLQESERRLQLALSAGRGIGTWDWDVPNDLVVSDERFARLYGVDPAHAALGAPIGYFFQGIHPDDLPGVQAAVQMALATGGLFSEEYRLKLAERRAVGQVAGALLGA